MTTTTMTKRRLAAALAAASLLVAGASGCSFGVLGSSDEKPTEQTSAAAPADNGNGGDQGSGSDGANPAQGASDDGGAAAGSDQGGENGKPKWRSSARPSSSLVAVVTTVMSIPRGRSILSTSIS